MEITQVAVNFETQIQFSSKNIIFCQMCCGHLIHGAFSEQISTYGNPLCPFSNDCSFAQLLCGSLWPLQGGLHSPLLCTCPEHLLSNKTPNLLPKMLQRASLSLKDADTHHWELVDGAGTPLSALLSGAMMPSSTNTTYVAGDNLPHSNSSIIQGAITQCPSSCVFTEPLGKPLSSVAIGSMEGWGSMSWTPFSVCSHE